jgi:hypothetical protein
MLKMMMRVDVTEERVETGVSLVARFMGKQLCSVNHTAFQSDEVKEAFNVLCVKSLLAVIAAVTGEESQVEAIKFIPGEGEKT